MKTVTAEQIREFFTELMLAYNCRERMPITREQIDLVEALADRAEDVAQLINTVP